MSLSLAGFVLTKSDDSIGYMHFTKNSGEEFVLTTEKYHEIIKAAINSVNTQIDNLINLNLHANESVQDFTTFIECLQIWSAINIEDTLCSEMRINYPECSELSNKQIIEEFMWPRRKYLHELRKSVDEIRETLSEFKTEKLVGAIYMLPNSFVKKVKDTVKHMKNTTDYIVYLCNDDFTTKFPKQCLDELQNVQTICINDDSFMGQLNTSWFKPWFSPYTSMSVSEDTMRSRNRDMRSIIPSLNTIVFCGKCKPSRLFIEDTISDVNMVVYKNKMVYSATSLKKCDELINS